MKFIWDRVILGAESLLCSQQSTVRLSFHLCLDLPSGFLLSGFPTRTPYAFLTSPMRATCSDHLILLESVTLIMFGEVAFDFSTVRKL